MATLLQVPLPSGDDARRALPAGGVPQRAPEKVRRWNMESLAGGICEISGPAPAAGLTAAARLIRDAQERGEPVAWISAGDSLVYAPDLHGAGVDLEALPVIRVNGCLAGARAAEHLLRSAAFGLLVLDLGQGAVSGTWQGAKSSRSGPSGGSARNTLSTGAQMRLAALCRKHQAALLLLARRPEGAPPIASLASLRAQGSIERSAFDRFTVRVRVLKDKRAGRSWSDEEIFRGPDGLC